MTLRDPIGFIDALAAVTASLASVVGLVVAADRLSLRFRMRRAEEWATAAAPNAEGEHRRDVLERIALDARATLVGIHLVPVRHFVNALLLPAIVLWPVASRSLLGDSVRDGALVSLVYLPILATGMRRIIRIYVERTRVVAAFLHGGERIDKPPLRLIDQMEAGVRHEFTLAWLLALAMLALLAGVALLVVELPLVGLLGAVAGGVGLSLGLGAVGSHAKHQAEAEHEGP